MLRGGGGSGQLRGAFEGKQEFEFVLGNLSPPRYQIITEMRVAVAIILVDSVDG
jgi:hypothetical protein